VQIFKKIKANKKIAILSNKKTFTESSRNVKLNKIKKLKIVIKELFDPISALFSKKMIITEKNI
jgi:hypothetical protein